MPLSGLDGCQRIDLHAWVAMLGGIALLGLAWVFVPRYGLIGLAWAQIAQGALLLIVSWALLRRELPALPILPTRWNYSLFREMFHYGVNFQVIAVASLLFEPTTKALLAKFGGLTLTAYYEMASRLVTHCRAVLVSANRVVVPRVATLQEISPEQIRATYEASYKIVFYLALPLYTIIAAGAPFVSLLWIGSYENAFVAFTLLLSAGYWLNTLIGPAYFVSLGTGSLRWNTRGHVIIGLSNALLGFLLGSAFGGEGVAGGYVLALVVGSYVVVFGHHRDNRISHLILWPAGSTGLIGACGLGLLTGWASIHFIAAPDFLLATSALGMVACMLILLPALWIHPLRRPLIDRLSGAI